LITTIKHQEFKTPSSTRNSMATTEEISCPACNQVICNIPVGSKKLPASKATIAIAKRDHKKLCAARDTEKTQHSRLGKCPVCCVAMRKDLISKHCARRHKAELIQSMTAENLSDAIRHNLPMAFGYSSHFAAGAKPIVAVCFHCLKGGIHSTRDNKGSLSKGYTIWKREHKNCIGKFSMDCFTHDGKPRKLLENTITNVSFADEDDDEDAPPSLVPAGGCGAQPVQGGLELSEETVKALREVSGYETDDECEETLLELIETALESQRMWKDRYLALVAESGH
jgi:hypothetical protein